MVVVGVGEKNTRLVLVYSLMNQMNQRNIRGGQLGTVQSKETLRASRAGPVINKGS